MSVAKARLQLAFMWVFCFFLEQVGHMDCAEEETANYHLWITYHRLRITTASGLLPPRDSHHLQMPTASRYPSPPEYHRLQIPTASGFPPPPDSHRLWITTASGLPPPLDYHRF
ncbi:predicted protein [Plenodomus lingam JN3]|uniref:Predicted protein n=1 Tax=Leptosphaeria maculans (strain JN3 / isolate v23.1.3 / race Av1-4-5-6-7-8) TaxID=985895 RepID=E5AFD5_LEPMJ|nr:predicted protein [Plenodomus lingam JN3]CBY01924.1 predicted protein [Plenodomus lingam JN3]